MKKVFLIFIILYLVSLQSVSAIGIGVTPGTLNFSVQVGISDTQSLHVINTGTDVSNYRVYVDENYADWFDISPDNFTLGANENTEVKLTLTPSLSTKGEFDFKIYAVSSSPSSDFSVGSGIKVPVHANVSNSGITVASILLVLSVIGIGCFYYLGKRKKREDN